MKVKLTKVISGYLTPKGKLVQRIGNAWYIQEGDDYIAFLTLKEVREWIARTGEDISRYS